MLNRFDAKKDALEVRPAYPPWFICGLTPRRSKAELEIRDFVEELLRLKYDAKEN